MTLDEAIEYEIGSGMLKDMEVADWLKVLKNIMDVGSCNECKSRGMCEYEPEAGQMTRFNCPFYKEERISKMTYGDIYYQFCKKFPNSEVSDFRPAIPTYMPSLENGIPNAIIVWLKDGSKVVYIAESEE